jgi:tRNA-dihydrouridine synthase
MRSHGPWYLKGIDNATNLRKELVKATTVKEYEDAVYAFQ